MQLLIHRDLFVIYATAKLDLSGTAKDVLISLWLICHRYCFGGVLSICSLLVPPLPLKSLFNWRDALEWSGGRTNRGRGALEVRLKMSRLTMTTMTAMSLKMDESISALSDMIADGVVAHRGKCTDDFDGKYLCRGWKMVMRTVVVVVVEDF